MSASAVSSALEGLPDWSGDEYALTRSYRFADFRQAMAFMQACIEGIEARGHHPEWLNVYNRINVTLRTHDLGDRVSEKDCELAAFLDQQAAAFG
jgi:4a-hydroxytetrahydrobiopterin dehydratase